MSIIDRLKPNEVLFVDRTGNLLIFYCKDDIKVSKTYHTIHQASKELTKYRKIFENQRVG